MSDLSIHKDGDGSTKEVDTVCLHHGPDIISQDKTCSPGRDRAYRLLPSGWQFGQTCVLVLPVLIFSTAVPHVGQGLPSR
jgi:hypothetical protein